MSTPSPLELARLDDDEAVELEALLLDLANTGREAWRRPWESPSGSAALELLDQLTTAGARQARIGAAGGKTAAGAERPLPYASSPLDVLGQIVGVLASWAVATADRDRQEWQTLAAAAASAGRVLPPPPAGPRALTGNAAATYLLARLPALIRRPGSSRPELDALRRLVRRGRALIDRPADRWYAGPCATPLRDADDSLVIVDGEQAYCTADLYVRPHVPIAVCPACTARHRVESRRAELLRLSRGHMMRAHDLARAVTGLGQPVTAERIRQWKRRGRLEVAGLTDDGQPMYLVGQVLDLVTADAARPARTRKARAA